MINVLVPSNSQPHPRAPTFFKHVDFFTRNILVPEVELYLQVFMCEVSGMCKEISVICEKTYWKLDKIVITFIIVFTNNLQVANEKHMQLFNLNDTLVRYISATLTKIQVSKDFGTGTFNVNICVK